MTSGVNRQIQMQLQAYPAHSLEDIDEASLMNRVDTKYIVPIAIVPALLTALRKDFSVLDVQGDRCFQYENIYYDTPCFHFYRMHHQGKLNRFKVRVRKYLNSGTQYLEVKFKNNKKRTLKSRIQLPDDYWENLAGYESFLVNARVPHARELAASQLSRYSRIPLASVESPERVSIDFGLQQQVLVGATPVSAAFDDIAIVEIKQARVNRSSPSRMLMKQLGIRPSGISKYCVGLMMASMENRLVKYNRFKTVARRIAKVGETQEQFNSID